MEYVIVKPNEKTNYFGNTKWYPEENYVDRWSDIEKSISNTILANLNFSLPIDGYLFWHYIQKKPIHKNIMNHYLSNHIDFSEYEI